MRVRPPVVERRGLAPRGYGFCADDRAEMEAIVDALRHVHRDALATTMDMLHYNRRLAGRIVVVLERLQVVDPIRAQPPRHRLAPRPAADARTIAEGVFGKKQARREQSRTITAGKGRRVTVVERSSRQMELSL